MTLICGMVISACISQTGTDTNSGTADTDETETVEQQGPGSHPTAVLMFRESSVRATGNEPFWMLEVKNDSIHFKLMSGFEFNEILPAPAINTEDSLQYNFKSGPATVSVLFQNKECVDNMSGFKSPFTVSVDLAGSDNTQHYNGCGDYLSAFNKVREQEGH